MTRASRRLPVYLALALLAVSLAAPSRLTPASAAAAPVWRKASPGAQSLPSMVYDGARHQIVLYGETTSVWDGTAWSSAVLTWVWDGRRWSQAADTGPAAGGHAVYDVTRRQVVVLDVAGATWTWDGKRWSRASGTGPGARTRASMVYDAARSRVVLFGGFMQVDVGLSGTGAGCPNVLSSPSPLPSPLALLEGFTPSQVCRAYSYEWRPQNDTWTWNGRAWHQETPATAPPRRERASMVYDAAARRVVLFGGYDGLSPDIAGTKMHVGTGNPITPPPGSLGDTWTWDGATWRQVASATAPSARHDTSMVYDATRRQTVLFGGTAGRDGHFSTLGDTWVWDGKRWARRADSVPSAREAPSMVYDAARSRVVLFGGSGLGDTWTWDGKRWAELKVPSGSSRPSARGQAGLVYDPARRQTVLFGGDTWVWDGKRWSVPPDSALPPARSEASMVYDAAHDTVLLFGGKGSDGAVLGDTWLWDGKRWSQAGGPGPSPRLLASMVYDEARRQVLLFGGSTGNASPTLGDTWVWDGRRWSKPPGTLQPPFLPGRAEANMVYDAAAREVVMFGGSTAYQTYADDTWTWNGTRWSPVSGVGPGPRGRANMVYDEAHRQTLLYGGVQTRKEDGATLILSDTWSWNGTRWAQAAVGAAPHNVGNDESYAMGMVYDMARRHMFLFDHGKSKIWNWKESSWELTSGTNPPDSVGQRGIRMVYDAARRQVVLLESVSGGIGAATWIWDGARWARPTGMAPPGMSISTRMVYDEAARQAALVSEGGFWLRS